VAERRRFSNREKSALALGAGGKCVLCGAPLDDGWHGDHAVAWSAGGRTQMANGQPTCPRCNLRKGKTLDIDRLRPRKFQRELHEATLVRVAAGEMTTVADVAPGSGKTLAYQWIATDLMRRELIDFAAIYTPRISLATQAETSYRREENIGGRLTEVGDFELFHPSGRLERIRHRRNSYPILPPGAQREAFVTCFASLTASPDLHVGWAREHEGRFLLIADEAQFCGADDSPDEEFGGTKAGYYIEQMAQYSRHALMLTGTPERADQKKIVLADYREGPNGNLYIISHASAKYRDGIAATDETGRHSPYLRRFEMSLTSIHVRLENSEDQELIQVYEGETSDPALYKYMESLKPVLRRPDVWQPVVDDTVKRLQLVQKINPEHRALIACMEKNDARAVYNYLRDRHKGLRVELAVSEDGPLAEKSLRNFKHGPADVLVTVRMAFLGYDCPKITVVGVLTNYRHQAHLMQLVMRGGRVWNPAESGVAGPDQRLHIVTTDDPKMRAFLAYLRTEETAGIREIGEGGGGGIGDGASAWRVTDAYVTKTAVESDTATVDADDRQLLEAVLHQIGPIVTVSQLAEAAEQLGLLFKGPAPEVPAQPAAVQVGRPPETEREIVDRCKSEAHSLIGGHMRTLGYEPADGNYQRVRARVTREINSDFEHSGIKSTEVITTKERARAYVAHVRSWIATQ